MRGEPPEPKGIVLLSPRLLPDSGVELFSGLSSGYGSGAAGGLEPEAREEEMFVCGTGEEELEGSL